MKKNQKQYIPIIIMMVVGASVGFAAATFGMNWAKSLPPDQLIILLILFVPTFFLVVAVHEAGHAFAGSLVNFDFRMYVVGPFMWDKEESGWKFKWNKNVNLSGGMVICLPTTTENLARRFSAYAFGGPAASLVLCALAYGIQFVLSVNNAFGFVQSFFVILSFLSLFIFIATIIPLHMNGFYTDGARVLRFLRGGETSRFETLLMKVITSSSGGIRPRQLDGEEVKEALFLAKKLNAPMGVYLHFYLYQIAFDKDDYNEAEKHLKNYIVEIESIPKGIRGSVFLDATFFYAYARQDFNLAEHYWKQYVPSAILPKAQVLAAEAAILKIKNEATASTQKIDMALNELPNMLDRGVAIALRERLMSMKSHKAELTR